LEPFLFRFVLLGTGLQLDNDLIDAMHFSPLVFVLLAKIRLKLDQLRRLDGLVQLPRVKLLLDVVCVLQLFIVMYDH
jgi:hypothetical protein